MTSEKDVNKKIVAKQRIAKWDNIKFFLIFFVVLGHFINKTVPNKYVFSLRNMERCVFIIYTFHMPAFIFISGLFAKKTIDNKRYDRIGSYLRLYFVMCFIRFAAKFFVYGKGGFSLFNESGVPWYALAMFFMFLIMVFLRPYNKVEVIIGTIVLGMVIGYDGSLGDYLALPRVLTFLPFFVLGYYFDSKKFLEFIEKTHVKIASAIILIGYVAFVHVKIKPLFFMYRYFLKGKKTYADTFTEKIVGSSMTNYGWLYRLIYYIVVFIIVVAFFSIIPNVRIPFITTLGGRTLSVFAVHYVFIIILMEGARWDKVFAGMKHQKLALLLVMGLSLAVQLLLSIKPLANLFNVIMSAPNADKK